MTEFVSVRLRVNLTNNLALTIAKPSFSFHYTYRKYIKSYFSLIYFAEKDAANKWSFMDSFWWGLMVLTTVGYGARAPHTFAGQVTQILIENFC